MASNELQTKWCVVTYSTTRNAKGKRIRVPSITVHDTKEAAEKEALLLRGTGTASAPSDAHVEPKRQRRVDVVNADYFPEGA